MIMRLLAAVGFTVGNFEIVTRRGKLITVFRFNYLGSFLNKDGSIVVEASARILEARAAYVGLKRLWHRPDISVKLICLPCLSALSLAVGLRAEDGRHLEAFDHQCSLGVDEVTAID